MTATYELECHELNDDFLKGLKETFCNKKITITVEEAFDETAFLLSSKANREHILLGIKAAKEGKVSRAYTIEELEALAQ